MLSDADVITPIATVAIRPDSPPLRADRHSARAWVAGCECA